jgi:hypothetical protein
LKISLQGITIATSLLMVGALGACNKDKNAMNTEHNNPYAHVKYDEGTRYGNPYYNGRSLYGDSFYNGRNNLYGNPYQDIRSYDSSRYYSGTDGNQSIDDGYNYDRNDLQRSGNHTNNNLDYAKTINNEVNRVNNVKKSITIIYGNDVIIGVVVNDKYDKHSMKNSIENKVKNYTKGHNVKIYFGENNYHRLERIYNDAKNGNDGNISEQLQHFFNNIGNKVR